MEVFLHKIQGCKFKCLPGPARLYKGVNISLCEASGIGGNCGETEDIEIIKKKNLSKVLTTKQASDLADSSRNLSVPCLAQINGIPLWLYACTEEK